MSWKKSEKRETSINMRVGEQDVVDRRHRSAKAKWHRGGWLKHGDVSGNRGFLTCRGPSEFGWEQFKRSSHIIWASPWADHVQTRSFLIIMHTHLIVFTYGARSARSSYCTTGGKKPRSSRDLESTPGLVLVLPLPRIFWQVIVPKS